MACPFCNLGDREVLLENELAFAVLDKYPVRYGHVLVIPKRHVASFFDLDSEEQAAVLVLVSASREQMMSEGADGVNVGLNDGEAAGQTIMHSHVHVIPRKKGDVDSPRGGVRNLIPPVVAYDEDAPL